MFSEYSYGESVKGGCILEIQKIALYLISLSAVSTGGYFNGRDNREYHISIFDIKFIRQDKKQRRKGRG